MSVFIEVRWYTGNGKTIGIVLRKNTFDNTYVSYIGVGIGLDEQLDIDRISDYGAKFPVDVARQLFMV